MSAKARNKKPQVVEQSLAVLRDLSVWLEQATDEERSGAFAAVGWQAASTHTRHSVPCLHLSPSIQRHPAGKSMRRVGRVIGRNGGGGPRLLSSEIDGRPSLAEEPGHNNIDRQQHWFQPFQSLTL